MLPNAKINVANGVHFTLNSCLVKACNKMWDGIYVNFPSSVLDITNTTIQDGINAVSSSNGGVVNVANNSVFQQTQCWKKAKQRKEQTDHDDHIPVETQHAGSGGHLIPGNPGLYPGNRAASIPSIGHAAWFYASAPWKRGG